MHHAKAKLALAPPSQPRHVQAQTPAAHLRQRAAPFPRPAPRLVQARQARSRLAPHHRSLSHLALRDHVAADARRCRDSLLPTFPARAFRRCSSLARARSDSVLRRWSGLGYYSRARNLHRAAKQIVLEHSGEFPRELPQTLALPGVGQYTAAAVLSIAYGQPLAVLDGNVARVLVRLAAVRGEPREPQLWRRLADAASNLLASDAPGDWNQAMMELGATVCTPRSPRCAECPVAQWCRAHAQGLADSLPSPREQAPDRARHPGRGGAPRSERAHAPVARSKAAARSFRASGNSPPSPPVAALAEPCASTSHNRWAFPPRAFEALASARHAVTFRDVRLLPFLARVDAAASRSERSHAVARRTRRPARLQRHAQDRRFRSARRPSGRRVACFALPRKAHGAARANAGC